MPPTEGSVPEVIEHMSSLAITTEEDERHPQVNESTPHLSSNELNLLAKTQYARSARAINALRDLGIDRLHFSQDLGIEPLEYSLPTIALVGNQSSGKSSLIEAISTIKLPKDIGTCTRCPMEVRLCEEGEEGWSCTVSLRRFNSEGANGGSRTEFFEKTTNKKEVEFILRRAQLAILNPDKPVEYFVHLDLASYTTASATAFSKDMIVVDIVGGEVNVTFIDLPGITNSDTKSDPEGEFKNMVEDLATSYLMDPNCLVLLTVSMQRTPFHKTASRADEFGNSEAVALANRCDKSGKRRIGVLTKADTVLPREHGPWIKILRGFEHKIKHGYYMTSQLSTEQVQQGKSWEDGRVQERKYFAKKKGPWLDEDPERLGTEKLVAALSKELKKMMAESLPTLAKSLEKHLKDVNKEIKNIPRSCSEAPQSTVLDLCDEFVDRIRKHTEGARGYEDFFQKFNDDFDLLKMKLHGTHPRFVLGGREQPADTTSNSEEDSEKSTSEPESESVNEDMGQEFSLHDLRELIKKKRTREFKSFVPWNAYDFLLTVSFSKWEEICLESFEVIEGRLRELVETESAKTFKHFTTTGLAGDACTVALKILEDFAEKTRAQIAASCRWECRHPFTQNHEEFHARYLKLYNTFHQLRDDVLANASIERVSNPAAETPDQTAVASGTYTVPPESPSSPPIIVMPDDIAPFCRVPGRGYRVNPTDLVKSLEEHENELTLISGAASYFQIAWKRIFDIVPLCIENEFLVAFTLELREKLREDLGVTEDSGREKCKKYAVEEPSVKEKKDSLLKMKETLDKAVEIVRKM